MKHLISINELLKSTYLRASRELGDSHKSRGQEMINWAAKSGEDDKQDRIYPHKFVFESPLENQYYFITDAEFEHVRKDASSSRAKVLSVKIELKSNWGESKSISLHFEDINPEDYRVDSDRYELRYYSGEVFRNKDIPVARKNALHLYRFFNQMWEDDICKEFPNYKVVNFSVNRLYKSA